jgi:PAS domain S-box-containing protein
MGTLKQTLSYLILGQKGGENRIQIINLLKERPYNLNQMSEILKLNYRTIKHHIDMLLKNELVNTSHTGSYGEVYFLSPQMEGNTEILEDVINKLYTSNKLRDFTSSPKFFQNAMEQINDAIIIVNKEGHIFFLNESAVKLYGYTPEEIIGEITQIFDDSKIYKKLIAKAEKDQEIIAYETKGKHKSGEIIDMSCTINNIKDDKENIIGFSIIARDISSRKQALEALKRSEERYALAQRSANIGSWDWDIQSGDLKWSDTIEPMFGFSDGEFGKTYEAFLDCVHKDDRQFVIDSVNACVEENKDYNIEHRIVWPNGAIRTVSETGDVVRDEKGSAIRMLGIVQDITERKQMEEAFLEAEETYRITLTNISDAVFVTDDKGKFTFICPNVHVIFGYSNNEVQKFKNISKILGNSIYKSKELNSKGELTNIEHEITDNAGDKHLLLINVKKVNIKDGSILYTCHDITKWRHAEEELKKSEEKYRVAFNTSPDLFYRVGLDGSILDCNDTAIKALGYSRDELIGMPLNSLYSKESQVFVKKYFKEWKKTGKLRNKELKIVTKKGKEIDVELNVNTIYDSKGEIVSSISSQRIVKR